MPGIESRKMNSRGSAMVRKMMTESTGDGMVETAVVDTGGVRVGRCGVGINKWGYEARTIEETKKKGKVRKQGGERGGEG
jgi:hypothetical protein